MKVQQLKIFSALICSVFVLEYVYFTVLKFCHITSIHNLLMDDVCKPREKLMKCVFRHKFSSIAILFEEATLNVFTKHFSKS